jgi:hypothetical protein
MSSLKKILVVGAAFAALSAGQAFAACTAPAPTPQSPPPCGQTGGDVAGTMTMATNEQIQLNNVSSDFKLKVHTAQEASAAAIAGGNVASATVMNQSIAANNRQIMKGETSASARAEVGQISKALVVTTYGFANGFTAGAEQGAAIVTSTQVAGPNAHVNSTAFGRGRLAGSGASAALGATAAGNVSNVSASKGDFRAVVTQTAQANVTADAKGEFCCNNGSASSAAIASANNATLTGAQTTMNTNTVQTSSGSEVTAVSDLYVGGASNTVIGASTASGNALTASNEFGFMRSGVTHTNSSAIMSQSWVTAGTLGAGSASAYGVGNTASMSNIGTDMRVSFDQRNSGSVQAWTALSGAGGVGVVNASAIGNASQGFLCTTCGSGSMSALNSQFNSGRVEAIGTLVMPSATTASGSAAAFGNASSFFVGTPRH